MSEYSKLQLQTDKIFPILLDSLSEGVVFLDRNGVIQLANRAAEQILGAEKAAFVGKQYPHTPWCFLDESSNPIHPENLAGFRSLKEKHSIENVELVVMTRSGPPKRIRTDAIPIYDSENRIEGTIVTFVDITLSHSIAEVLAKNEATMRAILENVPFGIILVDRDYRIITLVNRYAEKLIGLEKSEIEGRRCHQFICIAEEERCPILDKHQTVDNAERTLVTNRKEHIPVLKTVVPIEMGDQHFLLEAFVDIREIKALEAQLAQAQKLESVGRLASGIAHEINTPSQYVGDNLHFLKDAFSQMTELHKAFCKLKASMESNTNVSSALADVSKAEEETDIEFLLEDVPNALTQSIEGIEHISSIVSAMKEFAHPGGADMAEIDINHSIETTATVSKNEWKYIAELEMRLDNNLPRVSCYPGEINQVLLNLIVNAAHAIEEKKSQYPDMKGQIVLQSYHVDNGIGISVQDNGVGIPLALHKKIMEPFFTTKEVGKGTGQGLALAYTCISEKHKGKIEFKTEPGIGTTFNIILPLTPKDPS